MNENYLKEAGNRFKLMRKTLGLSQQEIGLDLGYSQPKINNLEKGERSITQETAVRLAGKYNISIDWLFLGIGEMFNPYLVLPEADKQTLKYIISKFLKYYLKQ